MSLAEPKTDAEWKANQDAHTLMRAEVIKADSKRLKAAEKAAKALLKAEREEADAMEKVAGGV